MQHRFQVPNFHKRREHSVHCRTLMNFRRSFGGQFVRFKQLTEKNDDDGPKMDRTAEVA